MKAIILPYDGKEDFNAFLRDFQEHFTEPDLREMVAYLKFNDANYFPDMSAVNTQRYVRTLLAKLAPQSGVFLDLKISDTNGTDVNTLKHFVEAGVAPDILTVRENIGAKGYLLLRRLLPDTKLALVSALTDIPEEEIRRRYGMFPALKIINDLVNIQAEYESIRNVDDPIQVFDAVVCSPHELRELINWFPVQYQYIVPGIRDTWMTAGQQARIMGVKEVLDLGATYVVMGSQLTEGSPKKGISAAISRKLTIERMKLARYSYFCRKDPIQMLYHCGGYYESRKDENGRYIGPLVAYAGKDEKGKNKVGFVYFNFAKAEENPLILYAYAYLLAEKIRSEVGQVDVVLGMPMGGLLLVIVVARFLNCRPAFAEKKVITPADEENGIKEEAELIINRHDLHPGDKVVIIEDVCNNFSTTKKAEAKINAQKAEVVAVACEMNRSEVSEWNGRPVASVCHIPSPQYSQDDPEVIDMVKDGNIIYRPKYEWDALMEAMYKK